MLADRRLLITGVLNEASIAFSVARTAQEQGARIVLSSFGRAMRITERIATRLPEPAAVIELDVSDEAHLARLPDLLGEHLGGLDGLLHAVAFAPASALGGGFLTAPWSDVATALQVSTWSLPALTRACLPLLREAAGAGGSVVGLDFDARRAWPSYDWMGVAKAALESATRYLARDVGPDRVRVNLVAAGPLRTMAATRVPGFGDYVDAWEAKAPLGWNVRDAEPVARGCVALLSDWFPATTGSIVYVDGGAHAIG